MIGGCLRVRCLWLSPGVECSPAELRWDGAGRITALRRARGPVDDLCVFPGLVDAHTHLQIGAGGGPRQFVPWARAVMAARRQRSAAEHALDARRNALHLMAEGVTAVGEIDSLGVGPGALAATGIAGRCYQELTGFDLDASGARRRVRERRRPGGRSLSPGLSPHAPYSVSPALFRAAAAASRQLAVHCAETPEEREFMLRGCGPFAELLRELGRMPAGFRAPGVGSVRWLDRLGLLRASTQLVHCQELEAGDVELVRAAGAPVVVCPGTMEWFGRRPPPVPRWLRAGVPVALGTDSRASSARWSLRVALAGAARAWPELDPAAILGMATAGGGRALSRPGLGRLRVGGRADLFAVPATGDRAADHVAAVVHTEVRPSLVLAGGRRRDRAADARR